jgi:hypothetical protein
LRDAKPSRRDLDAVNLFSKSNKMKKYFLIALFAVMGMGIATATSNSLPNAEKKTNSGKLSEKKTVVMAGVLNWKGKKKFNEPEPRQYASSCGTWTVTGSDLGVPTEQDYCNQACTMGWTWWKYENGVFTGGTGTPGGGGSVPQ